MKRIFITLITILITPFTLTTINMDEGLETQKVNETGVGLHSEEYLIDQDFIPIRTFLDLAKIGREFRAINGPINGNQPHMPNLSDYPDLEMLPANGKYFLANDIQLPYVGWLRIDIEDKWQKLRENPEDFSDEKAAEIKDLYYFNVLIPDYFRSGDGLNTPTHNNTIIRGWLPGSIPFSGTFEGNGFTISGLAGNRAFGSQVTIADAKTGVDAGARQRIGGLFGVIDGGIVRNLTVVIGQEILSDDPSNMGSATSVVRNAIRGYHVFGYHETLEDLDIYIHSGFGDDQQGGVGGIAGLMVNGGLIDNAHVTSLNSESFLLLHERKMGGLVGFMQNSTIQNSSTSLNLAGSSAMIGTPLPSTATMPDRGSDIGGLVGIAENSQIYKSYSTAFIQFAVRRSGGLAAQVHNSNIEDSFSGVNMPRVWGSTVPPYYTGHAGGLFGVVGGDQNVIRNVVSYTTIGSALQAIDGFFATGDGTGTFENIFTTILTQHSVATVLTREQMSSQQIVDNFINQDETFWHIEQDNENPKEAFPTFNPTPEKIKRVTVNTPDSLIVTVENIIMSKSSFDFIEGSYTLTINYNGRERDYELNVTENDINANAPIELWSITFNTVINEFHDMAFFREGDKIEMSPPSPKSFIGWFTDQFEGTILTHAKNSHIEVWARYESVHIRGETHENAKIYLISTDGSWDNIDFDAVNGQINIPNVSIGYFNLLIKLERYVDKIIEISTYDVVIVELGYITLDQLHITGTTPSYSKVIITDEFGEIVWEDSDTLSTGTFTTTALLLDGVYTVIIEKSGFIRFVEDITIEESKRSHINLNEIFEELEGRLVLAAVSISGQVKPNSILRIYEGEILLTQITASPEGRFEFSADVTPEVILRNGATFTIVALLEKFNSQNTTITIKAFQSEVFNFEQTELLALSGITSQRTIVQLINSHSGEVVKSMQSNAFGAFEFIGIENGDYTVRFERRGFEILNRDVTIEYSSYELTDLLLDRLPSENAYIGIIVQSTVVVAVLIGIWFVLYEKRKKKVY